MFSVPPSLTGCTHSAPGASHLVSTLRLFWGVGDGQIPGKGPAGRSHAEAKQALLPGRLSPAPQPRPLGSSSWVAPERQQPLASGPLSTATHMLLHGLGHKGCLSPEFSDLAVCLCWDSCGLGLKGRGTEWPGQKWVQTQLVQDPRAWPSFPQCGHQQPQGSKRAGPHHSGPEHCHLTSPHKPRWWLGEDLFPSFVTEGGQQHSLVTEQDLGWT